MKTLIILLFPALAFGELFNSDKAGFSYESTYSVTPKIEYSRADGIGYPLGNAFHAGARVNLGLASFTINSSRDAKIRQSFVRAEVQNKIKALGTNIKSQIRMSHFSKDFKELWLAITYKNSAFSLSSGEDEFTVLIRTNISTCNGEAVDYSIPGRGASLEEMIASFQKFDMSHILHCDFTVAHITSNAEHIPFFHEIDRLQLNGGASLVVNGDSNTITVKSPVMTQFGLGSSPTLRPNTVEGPDRVAIDYKLSQGAVDREKAETALVAGDRIAQLLTDYGDQLVIVANLNSVEKQAAIDAFFDEETVDRVVAALKDMNEGSSHLSLPEIITLHVNVNRAYAYVKYFELKVLGKPNFDYQIESRESP